MKVQITLVGVLILAAACGARGNANEEPPPAAPESQAAETAQPTGEESAVEVEGTLAPTVEAGGWVLETDDGTWLLLGIADYQKEPWFKEGARLKVKGTPSPDTITIFMQGTPLKVESMAPADDPK